MTQAATLAQLASIGVLSADTSGNVGIGTSTPVNRTTVAGGITLTPTYETYLVNSYYNNGWKYGDNGFAWGIGNNFGGVTNGVNIAVAAVNAGGANAALTWIPAFSIDSSGNVSGVIKSKTAVASTSGTSIDFTGIPSTAKRITVMFDGVSTNGASSMQIQLGTSSGVQTTGYNCIYSYNGPSNSGGAVTTGFPIFHNTAADTKQGHAIFVLLNNNVWVGNGNFGNLGGQPGYSMLTAGSKSLGATLDRVRITTVNGTDTFDAGTINILYE